jgi:WD40 repeat protein
VFTLCYTQVKWNRQNSHLLASSHDNLVHIWDDRVSSPNNTMARVSLLIPRHTERVSSTADDCCARFEDLRYRLVPPVGRRTSNLRSRQDCQGDFLTLTPETISQECLLAIQYWSIEDSSKPTTVIHTESPVWRARHLPFGSGVLTMPQRDDTALTMWHRDTGRSVAKFEGHTDVCREFVWRVRGGSNHSCGSFNFTR